MADYPGDFAWYELITTDTAAAADFYGKVVGWDIQDSSTPEFAYKLFAAGRTPVCGLMDLPEEARKKGATPRWMGYISVNDVDVTADRIKRLGGAVYVPPTESNIGRISVVADPQTGTFGLVKGRKPARPQPAEPRKPGRVGWHELHAADGEEAFAFYGELFGWKKSGAETSSGALYQFFSVGGPEVGGIFKKGPVDPVPFWLFYFNVGDIEAAVERVTSSGGAIFREPHELPNNGWIVRCRDPQGASFALHGTRSQDGLGWSSEWAGISSKGKLVTKPRGNA